MKGLDAKGILVKEAIDDIILTTGDTVKTFVKYLELFSPPVDRPIFLKELSERLAPERVDNTIDNKIHVQMPGGDWEHFYIYAEEDEPKGSALVYDEHGNVCQYNFETDACSNWWRRKEKGLAEIRSQLHRLEPRLVSQKEPSLKNPVKAPIFALLHKIKEEIGAVEKFELNENDRHPKQQILRYVIKHYPAISPHGFYRKYIDIDLQKRTEVARRFGKGYKRVVAQISDNDQKVLDYLKDFPE